MGIYPDLYRGTAFSKEITIFNKKGYMIENFYNSDYLEDFHKYVYKYNNKEKLIEVYSYLSNGNLESMIQEKYNDDGEMVEKIKYSEEGNINGKETYKYDKNGNKIEEDRYDKSGLYSKFTRKFDEKGNLIEVTSFNKYNDGKSGMNYKNIIQYDDNGKIIKDSIYNLDGSPTYQKNTKYNAKGEKVKDDYYKFDEKGNKEIDTNTSLYELGLYLKNTNNWEYVYDKIGNWIKQTHFVEGESQEIIEREIEYYL